MRQDDLAAMQQREAESTRNLAAAKESADAAARSLDTAREVTDEAEQFLRIRQPLISRGNRLVPEVGSAGERVSRGAARRPEAAVGNQSNRCR